MEIYDAEKAARVWQRVRGNSTDALTASGAQGLQAMIAQSLNEAAVYQQLSRRFTGQENKLLQRMIREEQAHCACLKGIGTLTRGAPPTAHALPPSNEATDILLRKGYRMALQSIAEYEARGADPEYGLAFTQIAARKRSHCLYILELLGKVSK